MKAVVCEAFGGPEVLAFREVPDPPAPGAGEVQVRIGARGAQYVDVLMLAGKYQFRPDPPFIPGSEAAGEVVAVGPDVTRFSVGDRVMSRHRLGAFAEFGNASAEQCDPIPAAMNLDQAAVFRGAYSTAYHALLQRGRLKAADRDHFAGRLTARDERRLRPKLVFSGQHQDIDILGAACPDPDLHLAGAGRRRVRDFAQGEDLRTAERLADDRFHPARRYSAASARAAPSCCARNFSMTSQFV